MKGSKIEYTMRIKEKISRLERLPVAILPCFVGVASLGNIYYGFGHEIIREISIAGAAIVLALYIVKIVKFPKVVRAEYNQVISASIYPGFSMIITIIGSYLLPYSYMVGKTLWIVGIVMHIVHIIIFTYKNIIRKRVMDTFVPTWFVTYVGIVNAAVIGKDMDADAFLMGLIYYGVVGYLIIMPLLMYRFIKYELKPSMYHTVPVILAPCSLTLGGYLTIVDNPENWLVVTLYICVLMSLVVIIRMLPRFFAYDFHPGFAGLTFPMAAATVTSVKMEGFLEANGHIELLNIVENIASIQLYLTTMIIGFVALNFLIMGYRIKEKIRY